MRNRTIRISVQPGPLPNCCVIHPTFESGTTGEEKPVHSLDDVHRFAADHQFPRADIMWRAGAREKLTRLEETAGGFGPGHVAFGLDGRAGD